MGVPDNRAARADSQVQEDGGFDDYAGLSVGSLAGENPVKDYQPYENLQNNNELASRAGDSLKKAVQAYQYVSTNSTKLEKENLDYSIYSTDKLIEAIYYLKENISL